MPFNWNDFLSLAQQVARSADEDENEKRFFRKK